MVDMRVRVASGTQAVEYSIDPWKTTSSAWTHGEKAAASGNQRSFFTKPPFLNDGRRMPVTPFSKH